MRRLLIVSYFCPPQPEAAAIRVANLVQHIPEFGWEPTVVTRQYPGGQDLSFKTIQVTQWREHKPNPNSARGTRSSARKPKLLSALARFIRGIIYFPDASINWLWPAIRATSNLAKKEHFDAILTTHGPGAAHIVGFVVAWRRGLPWVADYRDLWTGNPFSPWGPIHRFLAAGLERTIIKRANAVTAVAGLTSDLESVHKRKIIEIPNGTDQTTWDLIPEEEPASFQFCHAGSLYGGRMSPELLFSAVSKLRENGDPAGRAARFVFLGPDFEFVRDLASRFGLDNAVIVKNSVERMLAMRIERQSAVLLLLIGWGNKMSRVLGSKIVEYAGAGRPILCLGPANSAAGAVLYESGLGRLVCTETQCMEAVRDSYDNFKKREFSPRLSPNWTPWTGVDLARRFAATLDAVMRSSR